jgi:hypothetical protein
LAEKGSTQNDRNESDIQSPLGIATTRYEDRVMSSLGSAGHAQVIFEESQGLCGAGVLFLLPALLSQGLLRTSDVYQLPCNHYYGLESIVMTLAFMALSRIKNPEQLKQCRPGEIGRVLGLDRIPEVKCLREKIKFLTNQNQAKKLNNLLVDDWYNNTQTDDAAFLYIDGHVRIYYGEKAQLPAKFVSRQKLCLSATTEYWVNDARGMPVMMVMGELTEKLQQVIEAMIIPQLAEAGLITLSITEETPIQCTLVFDREAYEPAFFNRLWTTYKIAIITYRKNVKDKWPQNCFRTYSVSVSDQTVNMDLYEQQTLLGGNRFREIRKQGESGHQTAIITTHPSMELSQIAGRMFARWSQENFFRYLIQDYDFDKMISYGIETIDPEKMVVNPEYRRLTHQIKKLREKLQRIKSKLFPLADQVFSEEIDKIPTLTQKQLEFKLTIDALCEQELLLVSKRKNLNPKIKIEQMPDQQRYNKLKTESKLLMNVIKMICYRAESATASWIAPFLGKPVDEKRMVVKQIISSNADLVPDYSKNTLTVILHSLSAKRFNHAVDKLAKLLNETHTVFPGTNLTLVFKTSAI